MRKKSYRKERGPRLTTCPSAEDLLASFEATAHPDSLLTEEQAEISARKYLQKAVFGHNGFSIVYAEEI